MSEILNASAIPATLKLLSEPITLNAADAGTNGPKRYKVKAYNGGPMRGVPGFPLPVVVELSGLTPPAGPAPVLREHDPLRPIGHTDTVEITGREIDAGVVLSQPGPDTDQVNASAGAGYPWQASIGVAINRAEKLEAGNKANVNGRIVTGPAIIVRQSTWRELSFVTFGADTTTSAALAARLSEGEPMTFSEWLKAKGIDEAVTPEATLTVLRASYKVEQSAPTPIAGEGDQFHHLEAGMAKLRAKKAREDAITNLVVEASAKLPSKINEFEQIGKQAIESGWDLDRVEMKLLTASVAQAAPLVFSTSRKEVTPEVLEAAACRTIGVQGLENHFSEQTLDAMDKRFRSSVGFHRIADICARQVGFSDTVNGENVFEAIKNTYHANMLRASSGPSSYDIGGILSNVLRKGVREQFNYVEREWAKIVSITPVSDFKEYTTYSLTGDFTYEKIAKGGEIKHGTFGETDYSNQAESYGLSYCLDRTTIINDDMGALRTLAKRLGRGGSLKINDVVWGVFKSNTDFFKADNGNYDTGTDTAFSLDGLEAAKILWMAMTDIDGKPLGSVAKIVLVPPALVTKAERLIGSQYLRANDEEGENNPFAGKYQVVSSVYLNDSATAWYMLCDPNDIPVMDVCFLNGKQEPTIESVDMVPGRLGLWVQAYHDFGAALQEPRGGYKFKGVA